MTPPSIKGTSMRIVTFFAVILVVSSLAAAPQPPAQQAWKGKNLQYFAADIARDALIQRMREFSFALDVRCQYCHAGGNGVSFDGVDFASDERPAKRKARAMLKMTDEINNSMLTTVPSRAEPRVEVSCVTCHRGLPLPKTLQTTLWEIVQKDGVAAAVQRYRTLRAEDTLSGRYDFGEWEINELARRLTEAKDPQAAIAILQMNGQFYPKSADIDFMLGELHLAQGDRDKALARYKLALQKNPNHQGAKNRIVELEKR